MLRQVHAGVGSVRGLVPRWQAVEDAKAAEKKAREEAERVYREQDEARKAQRRKEREEQEQRERDKAKATAGAAPPTPTGAGAGAGGGGLVIGGAPKCAKCAKSVYANEVRTPALALFHQRLLNTSDCLRQEMKYDNAVFHAECFRCKKCKCDCTAALSVLNCLLLISNRVILVNVAKIQGDIYCKGARTPVLAIC